MIQSTLSVRNNDTKASQRAMNSASPRTLRLADSHDKTCLSKGPSCGEVLSHSHMAFPWIRGGGSYGLTLSGDTVTSVPSSSQLPKSSESR